MGWVLSFLTQTILGVIQVYLKEALTELPFPASLNPEFQPQH